MPCVRTFHLAAHCHSRSEARIFKVDRIKALCLTSERFEVPEDFDVDECVGESWGLVRGVGRAPELARIRFAPRAGRRVSEGRWHPARKAGWQPDGSVVFSMRAGVTPALVNCVLYRGPEARVLEPDWPGRAVRDAAAAVVGAYDVHETPDGRSGGR